MSENPFMMDLVVLVLLLPVLEAVTLGRNYRVLSPLTLFCGCFFTLYIMPYLVHFYVSPDARLSTLLPEDVSLGFNLLRQFLLGFVLVLIPVLVRLRRMPAGMLSFNPALLRSRMVWILAFFVVTTILYFGIGVGFSPSLMLDRAINPRAHTDLKAGLGPFIHLQSGAKFALIVAAAAWIPISKKSLGAIVLFLVAALLSILGGSKSSIVLPFIILVVVWQQCAWRHGNPLRKLWHTLLVGAGGAFLVIVGFAVFMAPGQSISLTDAVATIPSYHKEAYYLPLVVRDFPWQFEYPRTVLLDTLLAPIPRMLWAEKPSVGLWNSYFRPRYEANTVYYHTSTFGCLSEAHMLFGVFGPILYGAIWAIIVGKLYSYMLAASSMYKSFLIGTVSFWLYLLLRTGFWGVNFWILAIYMLLGWGLLRRLEADPYGMDPATQAYSESIRSLEAEEEYARNATY